MTSRERILAALSHKQPDRCPIDLGSNGQTGMNVSTLYRFRKALGLDNHRLKVIEPFQMLGEVEPDLLKLVGSDMIGLWNRGTMLGYRNENWKPWQMDDGTPVYMAGGFSCETDERGSHWVHRKKQMWRKWNRARINRVPAVALCVLCPCNAVSGKW